MDDYEAIADDMKPWTEFANIRTPVPEQFRESLSGLKAMMDSSGMTEAVLAHKAMFDGMKTLFRAVDIPRFEAIFADVPSPGYQAEARRSAAPAPAIDVRPPTGTFHTGMEILRGEIAAKDQEIERLHIQLAGLSTQLAARDRELADFRDRPTEKVPRAPTRSVQVQLVNEMVRLFDEGLGWLKWPLINEALRLAPILSKTGATTTRHWIHVNLWPQVREQRPEAGNPGVRKKAKQPR